MMFFSAHSVCFSRKPKQTHCGSHHKAWYLSGAVMSIMVARVSILFMSRLELSGSAEGNDSQDTVDHYLRQKRRSFITKCSS